MLLVILWAKPGLERGIDGVSRPGWMQLQNGPIHLLLQQQALISYWAHTHTPFFYLVASDPKSGSRRSNKVSGMERDRKEREQESHQKWMTFLCSPGKKWKFGHFRHARLD